MNVLTCLPRGGETAARVNMLIRSQGYSLHVCGDANELLARIPQGTGQGEPRTLVVTDYTCLDLVRRLSAVNAPVSLILLINDRLQAIACELLDCLAVQSFVAHQLESFEGRDFVTMLRKLSDPNIAGLEKYLGFGAQIEDRMVRTPGEKSQAILSVADFVTRLGGEVDQKRFGEYSRRVSEMVDELILNGLFDANPALMDSDRSSDFELDASEAVHIRWGFDGEVFGVSVRDPFGNLKKETIVHYLDENHRDTTKVHERKSAGLGIRLVFERMHQLVVNIKPSQMTEVICLLRFEKRFRDFEARLKSFHYYTI